ncbi:MAG: hypothetical protein HYZ89_05810 [Candidatus Omnitrophica bacterium]|nr:hypothetical protein [Candidatus Omnitrophota bacterium]
MKPAEVVSVPPPLAPSNEDRGPRPNGEIDQSPTAAFERLERALEVVRRQCPSLPVLAIRWMHVKHPLHAVQLRFLQDHLGIRDETVDWPAPGTGRVTGWIRPLLVRRIGQCLIYALYLSGRLARLRLLMSRHLPVLTRRSFDVLIKTFCFGPARPDGGRDFYFGNLQDRLVQQGVRTLVLCGNIQGGSWTAFARGQLDAGRLARLPELALLHPLVPFRLMVQQLRASTRLRRLAAATHDPLVKHISLLASRECLAPDTARTGLYFWIMRAAIRRWRPRAFLTVYEGHAWEVCSRWGVKATDPSCFTVGYQHTGVFPESQSLMSPSSATTVRLAPDVVLSLGRVPLALLAQAHVRAQTRVIRFGSFRYSPADAHRPADPRRRVVLVTPEGLVSEVKVLFEFAYACATRLPNQIFVLRCHPEVPMVRALRLVSVDLAKQPNIELSERRIEDDLARSSALLYRGSTTVLSAVLHGLLPLYFHRPTMLDRDPLYRMDAWRQRVTTTEEVADLLARHEQTPMERLEEAWGRAARYVADYTGPVGQEQIDAFLAAINFASQNLFTGQYRREETESTGNHGQESIRAELGS